MNHTRHLAAQIIAALHLLITITAISGWALPIRGWLYAYLSLLPVMVGQWWCNNDQCFLTIWEERLRTGQTPDAYDASQTFIGRLVKAILDRDLTYKAVTMISYGLVILCWLLGGAHLYMLPADS